MNQQQLYTQQQVDEIAKKAAQYAVSQILSLPNLDNGIECFGMPAMEGEENMARQRVFVTLPNGEQVWITGATNTELICNALAKYGAGSLIRSPLSDETFQEYTNHIFDVFLRPRWKPSTADTNKFLLDKHIIPFFGDMRLNRIDTATIQMFFQQKQHLSKSYTKQMLIMLHEIFENAIEDKRISEDPTDSKRITLPQKVTKRKSLELDQLQDIVSHINLLKPDDARFLALLCFTGMRRGEVLGLKWSNVSETMIHVCSEVIFKANTPVYNDYAKSKSGIRDIPISDSLAPYLANPSTGFVMGGEEPYTQSKFDRMWQRIGKTIDLYGATPHVFRHTYLSTLAASGVDPKTIQTLAGHADFSFTFNKYIDKDTKNIKSAKDKFEERLKLTPELTQTEPPQSLKSNESSAVDNQEN